MLKMTVQLEKREKQTSMACLEVLPGQRLFSL